MYAITNPYYKNHIYDPNRELDMELYIGEDKIDNSEVLSKVQFTFDSGMEEYTVGKITYGKLETVFYNTINITNGSVITIKLKLKVLNPDPKIGWEWVTVPWGSYIVTEVVKKELVINVTAYPSLYTKMNQGFFPESKTYNTRSLMSEMTSKLGIQFDVNNIPQINLENPDTVDAEGNATEGTRFVGKTYAELISLVAMVCASNVIFTRDGSIEFKKLDFNKQPSDLDVKLDNYKQPTRGEDIYTIKQVKMVNEKNEPFEAGETVVADQILSLSNQFATEAIAQSILESVKNISYKAWSSTFIAPLHLDPLDIITFNYKGEAVNVPAMYTKYTYAKNVFVCEIQSNVTSSTNKQTEFTGTITQKVNNIYTDVIQVKDMKADKVTVNKLDAAVADITRLYATKAEVDELYARKAEIGDLVVDNAEIKNLKAKDAEIEELLVNKANVSDLTAINAAIGNLEVNKATVADLNAANAEIDQLVAKDAEIVDLVAVKADISELNAVKGNIELLDTKVGEINTLVNGNLTSDHIQSLVLSADKVTVEDAFIEDAMIESLDVSKLKAGSIDTNKINLSSTDGSMTLEGSLQQFKDKEGNVRIQIGKDTSGDFKFILYDEEGEGILIDANGINDSSAIKDGLIVDKHVGNNANISAGKLDISSLFDVINKDGSHTIKGTKIYLDDEKQNLSVAFKELTTSANETSEATKDLQTSLDVQQGQINALIAEDTTIKGEVNTVKNSYTSLNTTINGISTKVSSLETTRDAHTNQLTSLNSSVSTLTQTNESISAEISQVKKDVQNIETSVDGLPTKSEVTESINTAINASTEGIDLKIQTAKEQAVSSANTNTTNVLKNYYDKSGTDAAIQLKTNEITSSVSSTYETKEDATSKINGVTTTISQMDTRLKNAEQKITEDAITSTVSKTFATKTELTNLDNKTTNKFTTVESSISTIDQRADSIELSVQDKVDMSKIISSINMTPETIKIDASKITLTGDVTIVGGGTLNSYIEDTAANSVEVGTVNLLNFYKNGAVYGYHVSGSSINKNNLSLSNFEEDYSVECKCITAGTCTYYFMESNASELHGFNPGGTYTLSGYIKSTIGNNAILQIRYNTSTDGTNWSYEAVNPIYSDTINNSKYVKFKATVNIPSNAVGFYIYLSIRGMVVNDATYFKKLKLEEGCVATTFSLSSSDTTYLNNKKAEEKAEEKASSAVSTYDSSLNQLKIFNKLTNNGETQGLYLRNNKLYINADYIQTGSLSANRIKTGVMTSTNNTLRFDLDNAAMLVYDTDNNKVVGRTVSAMLSNTGGTAYLRGMSTASNYGYFVALSSMTEENADNYTIMMLVSGKDDPNYAQNYGGVKRGINVWQNSYFSRKANFNDELVANGKVTINHNLEVGYTSTFTGGLKSNYLQTSDLYGVDPNGGKSYKLNIIGDTTFNNTIDCKGKVTINHNLVVNYASTFNDKVTIDHNLVVNYASTFKNTVTCETNLSAGTYVKAGTYVETPKLYGSSNKLDSYTSINMHNWNLSNIDVISDVNYIRWNGADIGNTSRNTQFNMYMAKSSDNGNHVYMKIGNDYVDTFRITCDHYSSGHKTIAQFNYDPANKTTTVGVNFWRALCMNGFAITKCANVSTASLETETLSLYDDNNTVQVASPISTLSLDGFEGVQPTKTQYLSTSINKTVTYNGTELVENYSEWIELPYDFLMCVDIQVTATPNKLCRYAITSKDEYGFVIECDEPNVTFDYVVIGTKMEGSVYSDRNTPLYVEPQEKIVEEEKEIADRDEHLDNDEVIIEPQPKEPELPEEEAYIKPDDLEPPVISEKGDIYEYRAE